MTNFLAQHVKEARKEGSGKRSKGGNMGNGKAEPFRGSERPAATCTRPVVEQAQHMKFIFRSRPAEPFRGSDRTQRSCGAGIPSEHYQPGTNPGEKAMGEKAMGKTTILRTHNIPKTDLPNAELFRVKVNEEQAIEIQMQ